MGCMQEPLLLTWTVLEAYGITTKAAAPNSAAAEPLQVNEVLSQWPSALGKPPLHQDVDSCLCPPTPAIRAASTSNLPLP